MYYDGRTKESLDKAYSLDDSQILLSVEGGSIKRLRSFDLPRLVMSNMPDSKTYRGKK